MFTEEKYTYITEEVRAIPVVYLLNLETEMRDEVRRTSLALKWVQGVKRIKMATKDDNGGRHGK